MADGYGDDHELLVLDLAQNTIVADAVAPEARKVVAESFAECARIVGGRDPRLQIGEDLALDTLVEFGEFALESARRLNRPGQGFSSSRRERWCRLDGGDVL